MKITIVDYKVANIYNIVKAMEYLGATVHVTDNAEDVERAEKLILPGVGAYGAGVRGLEKYKLVKPIRAIANEGVPVLGICLGAQLLMTEGREFGVFKGLDLIPGMVEHFPSTLKDVKVPHIGWNAIEEATEWKQTILEAVPKNAMMYFNHTYYLHPASNSDVLAKTTYGGFSYAAVIKKGNVLGAQFHPEKSAEHGLSILKYFADL